MQSRTSSDSASNQSRETSCEPVPPVTPIAQHAAVDFVNPWSSEPIPQSDYNGRKSGNFDQQLVLKAHDSGVTIWTDYNDDCSVRAPSVAFIAHNGDRLDSSRIPSPSTRRGTWVRGSLPMKVDTYYQHAQIWKTKYSRASWIQKGFQYTYYLVAVAFVYLVLAGKPLWDGVIYKFWYEIPLPLSVFCYQADHCEKAIHSS